MLGGETPAVDFLRCCVSSGRQSGWLRVAAAAGVLALILGGVWTWRPAPKLNVLLITLDTTRADHIGCYGHAAARTTAIDALAATGVAFENAYATVPLTLPSHAGMLTGLYPPENGLHNNGEGRLADVTTLAELLGRNGYQTGAFIGAVVLHAKAGLDRGFDVYDDDMSGGERHGDESHIMRNGRMVVDAAINWLQDRDASPFFCWVHLFDPHAPYDGHAEIFGDRFAASPYDGDIAFADVQIDRLLKHIRDAGRLDDTLVIVVGDHGEGFNEHEELEHGFFLYNSTLRVPLIVSAPRLTRSGHRVAEPVSLVDLFPTVLDCLQVPGSPRTSGASFKPALLGQPIEPRACYAETVSAFSAYGWAPLKCVTTADWKYVESTRDELYDLRNDPGELRNLLDEQPEQCRTMQQLLADLEAQMTPVDVSDVALTEADRRALESLGYLGGRRAPASESAAALPDVKDMIRVYNAEIAARKLMSAGQTDAAVAELLTLIANAPDYLPARLTLGAAYQMQNRLDEAAAVYEETLRIDPHSHDAHFDLAKLAAGRGDTDAAIEHYRAAIAERPSSAMAHINLATVLYSVKDLSGARQSFEAGLQASPESTVGHFNYGVFLAEQGELDAAIAHVRRAAELSPRNPQIQYQLGTLLARAGQFSSAADRFAEALRLNPHYPQADEQLTEARRRAAGQGGP